MVNFRLIVTVLLSLTLAAAGSWASEDKFDSEKMLSELDKKLELSQEQINKLKPVIDEKSAQLKKSIDESVEKGFVEIEKMSKGLDEISKDAEKQVERVLNSDEMAQLKEYLNSIDEEAIEEAKNQLIAEMTTLLELTEEQIASLKPIFEDGLKQLEGLLERLVKEGGDSLAEFKREYEKLSKQLQEKLQQQLDKKQMDKLEKYSDERKEKIQQALFTPEST